MMYSNNQINLDLIRINVFPEHDLICTESSLVQKMPTKMDRRPFVSVESGSYPRGMQTETHGAPSS